MKRIIPFGVLAALGVMLGCPIYGDGGGGNNGNCSTTAQCPSGETCNAQNFCQQGDCTQTGCSSGSTCTIENGKAACVPNTTGDSGTEAGNHPYSGCFADTDCATSGAGSKCLNAKCTTPPNQCADLTQCGLNEQCVQGVCTPTCSGSTTCPTGYSCDTNTVCTGNPTSCTVPGGACGSNGICIEQHCVSQCDTQGKCTNGLVCVNGGCMPNQLPSFTCTTEGVQAECASGSICLRHNCYISCATNANACQTASEFNVCKTVTTTSGSYQVCGSSANLGSDCDPTIGKNCPANGVCIDGYCH